MDHSPRIIRWDRMGWNGASLVVPLVDGRMVVAQHGLPQLGRDEVECVEADAGGDGTLDKVHADALVPPAEEALAPQHLQERARDRSVPEVAPLTIPMSVYGYSSLTQSFS